MKPITAADIAEMPLEQRIQLVEAIWDSIAEILWRSRNTGMAQAGIGKRWLPIMQTLPKDRPGRLLKKNIRINTTRLIL